VLCVAQFDLVVVCLDGDTDPVWPAVDRLEELLWDQPFALIIRNASSGRLAAARGSGAVAVMAAGDDVPDACLEQAVAFIGMEDVGPAPYMC
jgi:hypothetical protein